MPGCQRSRSVAPVPASRSAKDRTTPSTWVTESSSGWPELADGLVHRRRQRTPQALVGTRLELAGAPPAPYGRRAQGVEQHRLADPAKARSAPRCARAGRGRPAPARRRTPAAAGRGRRARAVAGRPRARTGCGSGPCSDRIRLSSRFRRFPGAAALTGLQTGVRRPLQLRFVGQLVQEGPPTGHSGLPRSARVGGARSSIGKGWRVCDRSQDRAAACTPYDADPAPGRRGREQSWTQAETGSR